MLSVDRGRRRCREGKPDPEGYLRALDTLNRDFVSSSEIVLPKECLALEDSIWGIEAAQKAGMTCVALTTSYSEADLKTAKAVFKKFSEISPEALAKLSPDR